MIRIQTILDTGNDQAWPIIRPEFVEACKKLDIEFVSNDPDVYLIHQTKLNDSHLNLPKPIIILERIDSAVITKRKELTHQNVIGIIKNTVFRDYSLYNTKYCWARYHARLIVESMNLDEKVCDCRHENTSLNSDDLNKIECGYTFALYRKMQNYPKHAINYDINRSIDIHFRGTTFYGPTAIPINTHRQLALEKIKSLKNCTINAGNLRSYKGSEYEDVLKNSKIVLSPWGLGEACYRDFEAIYCGSILVKPDTSFVKGIQDIYQNNRYYIPCKVDFSDLQDIVNEVKNNWRKYDAMRKDARDMLLKWWNIELFSQHFRDIIHRRLYRIKQ